MRLALLLRHGQSVFNVDGVVNGDPALDRGLSPVGFEEGERLSRQIVAVEIDLCVVSEFLRARQTADLALSGRDVPRLVDSELDDVRIGELEGKTLAEYRAWKRTHSRDDRFPGGESLNDAARRYATALERLVGRTEDTILVVCHEIPVRYAVNGAAGSDSLDGPLHDVANATPYLFDEAGLRRAVDRMRALASENSERA
jgi:probable phosphoglycerate mutase